MLWSYLFNWLYRGAGQPRRRKLSNSPATKTVVFTFWGVITLSEDLKKAIIASPRKRIGPRLLQICVHGPHPRLPQLGTASLEPFWQSNFRLQNKTHVPLPGPHSPKLKSKFQFNASQPRSSHEDTPRAQLAGPALPPQRRRSPAWAPCSSAETRTYETFSWL